MRMRVEREKVLFYGIRFKSKAQRLQAFDKWAGECSQGEEVIQSDGDYESDRLPEINPTERNPTDFELLMSRRSTETHTFMTSWGVRAVTRGHGYADVAPVRRGVWYRGDLELGRLEEGRVLEQVPIKL